MSAPSPAGQTWPEHPPLPEQAPVSLLIYEGLVPDDMPPNQDPVSLLIYEGLVAQWPELWAEHSATPTGPADPLTAPEAAIHGDSG